MTWVVGPVELDGVVEVLAQYDTDVRWNGWLCPRLDPLGAVEILDGLNAQNPSEPPYSYEFIEGVLHVRDLYDPENPPDLYEPDEDGLYDLGSHAWIWSAVREPERAVRHLRVVPTRPEVLVCMYADTGNGPCGGPLTQIGDGHDYCWLHKDLRQGT